MEQKLLPHLISSKEPIFLSATVRPDFRPLEPNPENKKELPDENTWAFDEYHQLREVITRVIDPLDEYLKTYAGFEKDYLFDPDTVMAPYEDPENWPEVEELRARIVFHQKEEKRLQSEIPEEIVCSIFKITTAAVRDKLAAKHH